MKKYILFSLAVLGVLAISTAISVLLRQPMTVQGGVPIANEYLSTSTPAVWLATGKPITLQEGNGALGSVTITGAGAGSLLFYDATTTDITKRTGALATSTIASIPVSAAAGTYTFDARFSKGLIVEMVGSSPTTTITWR